MKKTITLFAAVFFLASITIAQTTKPTATVTYLPTKIGFVDYALIRDTLPLTDTFEIEIQSASYQYQMQLEELQKDIEISRKTLASISGSDTSETKSYINTNLNKQEKKYQDMYEQAQYVIGNMQQEALQQLDYIVSEAVKVVAKSKNYTAVFDISSREGGVMYMLPQDDLTLLVAKQLKLNLK